MSEKRHDRIRAVASWGYSGAEIRRAVRMLEAIDAEHNARLFQATQDFERDRQRALQDHQRALLDTFEYLVWRGL